MTDQHPLTGRRMPPLVRSKRGTDMKARCTTDVALAGSRLANVEMKSSGSFTLTSACITTFSFNTNGFQGGDGGHGGYLDIVIDGGPSTMMSVALDDQQLPSGGDGDHIVKIRFLGDCEMEVAARGLRLLASQIERALDCQDE